MGKLTILFADDEADVRDSTGFALAAEGYQVFTAANGLEALSSARKLKPDLIVLDALMPKANGYRVCKQLKEDQQEGRIDKAIPIILLTARNLTGDPGREKFFMDFSRANHMMYKPFDTHHLVQQIQTLLRP
jgi:CheY-like chemotaxis protein